MNIRQYPKTHGPEDQRGFTAEEIRRGEQWLYADITCPHCGKLQPVAVTHYVGGPCIRCGKLTSGETVSSPLEFQEGQ